MGGLFCEQNLRGLLCSRRGSVSGSSCRGGLGQDAMVNSEQRKFKTVGNADLVVNVAQVIFDDLLGGAELRCDFLVLVALHDQGDDAEFLGGEAVANTSADEIVGVAGGDGTLRVEDVSFAALDTADAIDQ